MQEQSILLLLFDCVPTNVCFDSPDKFSVDSINALQQHIYEVNNCTFIMSLSLLKDSSFLIKVLTISKISSVSQSCLTLCDPMDCSTPGFPVHHQLLELAQTHVVHRLGDAIQLSYLLSSPSSPTFSLSQHQGFFPVSQFFKSSGQSIGALASASVIPINIQDQFPLRLTSLIPLLSKGLSRVFSSITVQKHQFFGTQPSLWSNSHILTRLLEK